MSIALNISRRATTAYQPKPKDHRPKYRPAGQLPLAHPARARFECPAMEEPWQSGMPEGAQLGGRAGWAPQSGGIRYGGAMHSRFLGLRRFTACALRLGLYRHLRGTASPSQAAAASVPTGGAAARCRAAGRRAPLGHGHRDKLQRSSFSARSLRYFSCATRT